MGLEADLEERTDKGREETEAHLQGAEEKGAREAEAPAETTRGLNEIKVTNEIN